MRLTKYLTILLGGLVVFIMLHDIAYDKTGKEKDIQRVSKKIGYTKPAFSFISKDYREYVYENEK